MGCCTSRESSSSSSNRAPTAASPPTRRHTSIPAATSQTAINPPLSTTTSNQLHPSARHFDPATSTSNISTPRTSIHTDHPQSQRGLSLTEHYNVPLLVPKPWTSTDRLWTRSQLQRERQDFFDTRVAGRKEVWAALKQVAECIWERDLADAQGILDALGITLPTGRLEEGAYDERGMLYRLPEAILSDPLNLVDVDGETVVSKEEPGKAILDDDELNTNRSEAANVLEKPDKGKQAVEKDAVKVKCRLSDRGGPDVVVLIGKSQPVGVLIKRIRSEVMIASSARIRLAYLGHILDEKQSLDAQGWKEGHVIQALVVGAV